MIMLNFEGCFKTFFKKYLRPPTQKEFHWPSFLKVKNDTSIKVQLYTLDSCFIIIINDLFHSE